MWLIAIYFAAGVVSMASILLARSIDPKWSWDCRQCACMRILISSEFMCVWVIQLSIYTVCLQMEVYIARYLAHQRYGSPGLVVLVFGCFLVLLLV